MSKDKRHLPRRESFVLRTRTIRFIEEFPHCGTLRTISRAGLNGMEAIERGRAADGFDGHSNKP